MRPGGESQGTWSLAFGTQFPPREDGDGSGQRCRTGSCWAREASDLHVGAPRAREGTDRGSGSPEREITDPAAPLGRRDNGMPWSRPFGLNLHLRTVGAWASVLQAQAPRLPGRGPGGTGGWSLAGLQAVFGRRRGPVAW